MESNFNSRWEASKNRKRELDNQLLRLNTMAETAEAELTSVKNEARELFGTDDLNALRDKLVTSTRENEEKLSQFEGELVAFESALSEITSKLSTYNA